MYLLIYLFLYLLSSIYERATDVFYTEFWYFCLVIKYKICGCVNLLNDLQLSYCYSNDLNHCLLILES